MTGRKAIPDGSRENAASRCYRFVNTAIRPSPAPSTQSKEIVNACQIADSYSKGRAHRSKDMFDGSPAHGHRIRRPVQALDGLHALPDAQAAQCRYRDEFDVLAYNLTRALRILGFKKTMKAMRLVGA
jgi:hypothetical protein